MIRTYTELIKIPNFADRYEYLKLNGEVGVETFGFDRYLNQALYRSKEWKKLREEIILRDNGCDMAHEDHEIIGPILIHHMNPITQTDILHRNDDIMDPEFLICVTHKTHNAIHYGYGIEKYEQFVERKPNDTSPWRLR